MVQLSYVKDNINQFSAVYRVVDFSIIQIILLICIKSYSIQLSDTYVMIGLIATIAFFVVAESIQLYRSWRTSNALRLPLYTFASWVVAVFAVTTFLFFSKTSVEISRLVIGFWFVLTCFSLISWRLAVRVYLFKRRRMGFNSRKVAIFGLTHSGVELANQFQNSPEAGFTLSAFFDDRDAERLPNQFNDKLQGDVNHGVEQARSGRFNAVYIALPLDAQKRIESILRSLGDTTVDVHLVPDNFIGNLLHARTSYVGNIQTISVYESPLNLFTSMAKRLEDIIGSIMILCGIAIPMLIIAMLIKLDSSGPVFFKQKRYGLDGKAINVWKFRSMTVADNGDVVKQATKGDARITKLGAMLRRTSLDELPQFINVLQGQMSIVGPRPHAVAHNEQYRSQVDFYMLRHKVKPGITGWAQINGWRGETDTLDKMEKRIEFDLEYIRNWSILLDLRIIFLTIFKGFVNKNAY
ncbi:undecaprenyl-phosphate glucose phosphotransferase [Psychromonas sp. psych-6C06]|uniref:undecaprenyl-phosphate glucose phosphotransferase n=1 Tax=Psychromonas sp. psych-6C06 TaxID=2058089 RepID=UPI000C342FF6|nr:undecaprenyl-phosphate glucose phosphotransferase [Psychromonas sp. psych-6C06]PKF61073.1 undecaprenyl-phosphate glucose phosphotransferase [Psychromonas sp. psych-6C06]